MSELEKHDPLPRQRDGEPHFVLLSRDWSAPEIVRIWLAIRKRDDSLIDAIVKRIKRKMHSRPYHPKDAEHVVSAQQVAIAMELWTVDQSLKPIQIDGVET